MTSLRSDRICTANITGQFLHNEASGNYKSGAITKLPSSSTSSFTIWLTKWGWKMCRASLTEYVRVVSLGMRRLVWDRGWLSFSHLVRISRLSDCKRRLSSFRVLNITEKHLSHLFLSTTNGFRFLCFESKEHWNGFPKFFLSFLQHEAIQSLQLFLNCFDHKLEPKFQKYDKLLTQSIHTLMVSLLAFCARWTTITAVVPLTKFCIMVSFFFKRFRSPKLFIESTAVRQALYARTFIRRLCFCAVGFQHQLQVWSMFEQCYEKRRFADFVR